MTVTHPDMVRYFMTIREACDLVVTAASHALGAENADVSVYVLNMGQPVRIMELAERMIQLSGLEPGRDIRIEITGVRPGERLNEILFAHDEPIAEIGIAGIVAAKPVTPSVEAMRGWIATPGAGARAQRPLGDLWRAARRGAGFFRRGGVGGQRRLARPLHVSVIGRAVGRPPLRRGRSRIHDRPPARRHQLLRLGDERSGELLPLLPLADQAERERQQGGRHRNQRGTAAGRTRAASR